MKILKVTLALTLYIYAVQVSLGGSELSEGERGEDAMGGKSEEDDFEIQMDHLDSDYDESDQDGVTEGFKKEGGKYFSDLECSDIGLSGASFKSQGEKGKSSRLKGKVASGEVELATRSQRNRSRDLKMSHSCSRVRRGLKLIIRKQ